MLTRPDGSLLNTCTSDAIIQMLRFLKRAYWPFAWDSSQGLAADSRGLGIGGGFAAAAKVCLHLCCCLSYHTMNSYVGRLQQHNAVLYTETTKKSFDSFCQPCTRLIACAKDSGIVQLHSRIQSVVDVQNPQMIRLSE